MESAPPSVLVHKVVLVMLLNIRDKISRNYSNTTAGLFLLLQYEYQIPYTTCEKIVAVIYEFDRTKPFSVCLSVSL